MTRGLLLIATVAVASAAAAEVRLRDHRSVEMTLAQPAARIVTLAPYLTELAFAAGAGDKLVGVSAFSDFPPEAQRLPRVSDSAHVDFEAFVRLAPDLVLAWRSGNRARDIAQLEARGLRVFVTEPAGLEDVPPTLLELSTTVTRLPRLTRNSASSHPCIAPPMITIRAPRGIQSLVSQLSCRGPRNLKSAFDCRWSFDAGSTILLSIPGICGTTGTPPTARTTTSGLICSTAAPVTCRPSFTATPSLAICVVR